MTIKKMISGVPCFLPGLRGFCLAVVVSLPFLSCQPLERTIHWKAADAPCSTTFVLMSTKDFQMYRWEPHQLTLLYSGAPPKPLEHPQYMGQSAYVCETNEIVCTTFADGLTRLKNNGDKKNFAIKEGANHFEQYPGHLLLHTTALKLFDNPRPSLEEVMPLGDQAYLDILDYNLRTGEVEKRYPIGIGTNFMFHTGNS